MSVFAIASESSGPRFITPDQLTLFDPQHILFLISGPDDNAIRQILDAVVQVAKDLQQNTLPHVNDPDTEDSSYVYGYFKADLDLDWDHIFYIGKGTGGRWLQHLRDERRRFRNGQPPRNAKEKLIQDYLQKTKLGTDGAARGGENNSMVHKLYVYSGTHAELTAFFVEYFLIQCATDSRRIANDTSGNRKCGSYVGLVKPSGFDAGNSTHRSLWSRAVSAFRENPVNPQLAHTLVPALHFIGARTLEQQLTNLMSGLKLIPLDTRTLPENRLTEETMPFQNASVSGASDAVLSYGAENDDMPFRLDFRLQPHSSRTVITLRPLANYSLQNRAFLEYMDAMEITQCSVGDISTQPLSVADHYGSAFVKNRNNWPFCKPLAWRAEGNSAPWHDIVDAAIKTPCKVDWINGHFAELNLQDACELVLKSLAGGAPPTSQPTRQPLDGGESSMADARPEQGGTAKPAETPRTGSSDSGPSFLQHRALLEAFAGTPAFIAYSRLTSELKLQFAVVIDWIMGRFGGDIFCTNTNREFLRIGVKELQSEMAKRVLLCIRQGAGSLKLHINPEGDPRVIDVDIPKDLPGDELPSWLERECLPHLLQHKSQSIALIAQLRRGPYVPRDYT